ncbi:hypothetical protein JR316_0004928 [Psilocybe cubensis]|uniref:Uncharacterized protein n=1 Tax=Psilocybe cubensis TaxID=181762 RepID=A0ACB8H4I5_PSICU|nr:hypothetical protein JR316_0004928 [Psilocybe cubensis]KAH9482828.1 hypothetical protein JR316_0004928 [Psilocybe cubensis]
MSQLDPKVWTQSTADNGDTVYYCKVCCDSRARKAFNCPGHERTSTHLAALSRQRQPTPASSTINEVRGNPTASISNHRIIDDALRALLVSSSSNPRQPMYHFGCPPLQSGTSHATPSSPPLQAPTQSGPVSPLTGFDWNLYEATQGSTDPDQEDEPTPCIRVREGVCQWLLDLLDGVEENDDPVGDILVASEESDSSADDLPARPSVKKRTRTQNLDPRELEEWYPWQDKITCSLDILMHLPRSVFSRKQLDLFLWILRVNEVRNVPSIKTMKTLNSALQKMCGIDTIPYTSTRGTNYSMNNISQILAQEMSNPKVRPYLSFFPEDTGKSIQEARQAAKWLHEIIPERTTPMIRLHNADYYIFEPTMLKDGSCVIPYRWYVKSGHMYACSWVMEKETSENGTVGWVVRKDRIREDQHPEIVSWTHTDPATGNRWRKLAQGHRTVCLPLWLYCDDTSGNQSKQWNEHNSYLFTLAGLPRDQLAKEYNIHFICTSNVARPLEMLEGVVNQIKSAQETGIWAWDCVYNEVVLAYPAAFAFLGDNPMQSEFACHIGMCGKLFCRVCWAKGQDGSETNVDLSDLSNVPDSNQSPLYSPVASENGGESIPHSPATSDHQDDVAVSRKRKPESMESMVKRITAFLETGRLRCKQETIQILQSYLNLASSIGSKTKLKTEKTKTGIKDTYQDFFLEKLLTSYAKKKGPMEKQAALDEAIQNLPDDIISPIWDLDEIDPHQDTPVEILHVVLLGFVKYFWRDLVQNQLNDEGKKLLIQRLNSFDYAGSLTGRDFQAISQVAPHVIYDLVPTNVFDAWVSLSRLVPLIYQPKIDDMDKYLVKHVRRFGPAIIFATESFESFNAVIRAKSIHSNRQSPSRDIAMAFAEGNRIRHLLSGGLFLQNRHRDIQHTTARDWRSIGPGPNRIIAIDTIIPSYLGLMAATDPLFSSGRCIVDKTPPRPLTQTLTGTLLPNVALGNHSFQTCKQVQLENGENCEPGQYVIVQARQPNGAPRAPFVACVKEIVLQLGSSNGANGYPEGLLLQSVSTNQVNSKLQMPALMPLEDTWSFLPLSNILCTVNAPHDCAQYNCTASGVRYVYQERKATTIKTPVIEHKVNPDHRVLNMGQMRNSIHLQQFRVPARPIPNKLETIHEAVSRTIDTRKAAATSGRATRGREKAAHKLKGQGHSRHRDIGQDRQASIPSVSPLSPLPSAQTAASSLPPPSPVVSQAQPYPYFFWPPAPSNTAYPHYNRQPQQYQGYTMPYPQHWVPNSSSSWVPMPHLPPPTQHPDGR